MFNKKEYSDGNIDYPGVGIISDNDVANFVKEHTHWWERLDAHWVSDCAINAMYMLMEVVEKPKKKKWYFSDKNIYERYKGA